MIPNLPAELARRLDDIEPFRVMDILGALAWSVLALSIVAITLLLVMIRRGRPTEVASLMYLTPPTTAVFAWLIFGERLGVLAWMGVVVTMAGVALVLKTGTRSA